MSAYRVAFGHVEIGETARRHLQAALDRHWVSQGPNVEAFEQNFAAHFGYGHAVAASSGTSAGTVVWAALADARGWSRGDEVLTPAAAFVATANCILAAGLTPRFVDVRLDTLNIDPDMIAQAITPRTRAIQAVHTMGRMCEMATLHQIAERHGLAIVEDGCEAHGASRGGRLVGSMGEAAVFSFYAAHLICSGEGGMIVTGDADLAATCRSVRSHGRRDGALYFAFDRIGFNAKMNDLEAAIGLEGLEQFDAAFATRRHLVAHLTGRLQRWSDRLHLPTEGPDEVVAPHAYPLVLTDPSRGTSADLSAHLEAAGIQCKTLFGSLPTQHAAFRFMGEPEGRYPVAEFLHTAGLHIGVHQYLTEADMDYVADAIDGWFTT